MNEKLCRFHKKFSPLMFSKSRMFSAFRVEVPLLLESCCRDKFRWAIIWRSLTESKCSCAQELSLYKSVQGSKGSLHL